MHEGLPPIPGTPQEDYDFFLAHADEVAADLRSHRAACAAAMERFRAKPRIRVLDFGCGPGAFSVRFLQQLGCAPARLELTLLDPHRERLANAAQAVAPFTMHPLQAVPHLPTTPLPPFDLILANQSFYYVQNLAEVLPQLVQVLAPDGILLATIGSTDTWLLQLWRSCYEALGLPFPHHTAANVDVILADLDIQATVHPVPYHLRMPDSAANRARILRLLMGRRYEQLPPGLLEQFSPFASAGHIDVPIAHRHYAMQRRP